ncbi:MAG: type II secretion system secretin GspD [Gammaproteobacteria bacterium]|nr:type II secretion system secretin GspD [Gammaproteobacteria bacterium]
MIRTNRAKLRAFIYALAGHPPVRLRAITPAWLLAAALLLPAATRAEPVTLNLKDADISAVIGTISEITGKNFIVDPRVKGKITIISSRPMESDEVYQVFLSVLDVYGFSAVPSGKVVKIIPDANAKQIAVPTTDDDSPGRGDEFVTRVIELRNVSAAQLVPILRPLVPQQGHLAAYVPSNMLIIADRASNITRLVNLINRIDLPSSEEIEIVPLQHASAAEIVRIMTALAQQDKARGGGAPTDPEASPVLIADERTNSVLIGGGKSGRLRLRALISHLDTPLQTQGNTRVIYLRYAQAKDLVPVLTGVSSSVEQQGKVAGQAAAAPANNLPINIQADESSNSLVITAPPDIFNALEGVIKQLDIRRAQVMVEGIIAEVSTDRNNELGVQWIADGTPGGNGPVGVTNFSNSGSISDIATAIATSGIPSFGNGLTLGVGRFNSDDVNFAAILQALKSDGSTNILSTPSLVTLDNEEAEIVVGQEVPFVTGSFTSTGTGTGNVTNPFQTISRENVGITLKVKPQINEGDAVKLDIEQTIDSLSTAAGAVDLITNTRSIKTSIIVDDRQVVVLGGLIRDDVQESLQKVPLLGDIPLLGMLFRSKTATKNKTNLMVFLQTTILRDVAMMNRLTGSKYNYIRNIQLDTRDKGLLMMPDSEAPVMPALDDLLALPPAPGGTAGRGAEQAAPK